MWELVKEASKSGAVDQAGNASKRKVWLVHKCGIGKVFRVEKWQLQTCVEMEMKMKLQIDGTVPY